MLFCSKYNFIFVKSIKTASTSVEVFLEQLFHDNPTHSTEFIRFSDGSIVGLRGAGEHTFKFLEDKILKEKSQNSKFCWNHMSLFDIKNVLGEKCFSNAFKVTTIRNPYTRMISSFHNFGGYTPEYFSSLKNWGEVDLIKQLFLNYLKYNHTAKYNGEQHFYLNDKCCIDFFVRKEFIFDDLKNLLNLLGVPVEKSNVLLENIPHYKKNSFLTDFQDYYSPESFQIVNNLLSKWFVLGNYEKIGDT